MFKISIVLGLSLVACLAGVGTAGASTLFAGTDERTFDGVLPDQMSVSTISGASVVSSTNYSTTFHLNGLTDVSGQNFLYSGSPESNVINKISYTGALISSATITGLTTACCSEDMIWTGTQLYHGNYGSGIQLIDLTTDTASAVQAQPDVVGMSYADGAIWITHWAGRQVGIWNPATNAFTAKFTTPTNAGGLAFDDANQIMWVGLQGGNVVPYTLAGVALNGGFQPFGAIGDTVDGLAFLGEAKAPEPATWALMVIGFGGLGLAARSRRRTIAA